MNNPQIIQIENWSVTLERSDGYTAPERLGISVRGNVTFHPRGMLGSVWTSKVVAVEGRIITTQSGSRYELGEPDPRYAKWCEERGKPIDPAHPIIVRRDMTP